MTGPIVLVFLCFVAVCAAFPHAAYDIKPLQARVDGCSTTYITMTAMATVQPAVRPVTRTARLTLLVHITPFYNGSTATRTETVSGNSTATAMEIPTTTWGTFSVPWSKISPTSVINAASTDTIAAAPDTTSATSDTTPAPSDMIPVAPGTTAATPDTTATPPGTTASPPDTAAVPPDTLSAPPDTTTAAGNTPPAVWNKTTPAWNTYPVQWNTTTLMQDKRMVMPTANEPTRYWNTSGPYPTGYYPTHGPTYGSLVPPESRICEVTSTYTSTAAQTLPAPSYVVTQTAITRSTLFDYDHLTPPVYHPAETPNPNGPADNQRPGDPPATTNGSPSKPGQINGPPQAGPANPTATKKAIITDRPDSPVGNVPNGMVPAPIVTLPGAGPIAIDPSRSVIIIGDKTSRFNPGQQTTINDVPISFDSSAGFVVIGGSKTIGLPPMTPAPVAPPAVIGGTTVDINQIATQLKPGQATTIGSDTISRDNSGSFLVVDGTSTIALPQGGESIPRTSITVVNGIPIPIGELASELAPGQKTVIGSMTISRDGSALVIGTSTVPLPATTDKIVLGGTTISAGALPSGFSFLPSTAGGGLLLPNGETLMPGSETTIDGIDISLTPGQTPVAVIDESISVTATGATGSTSGDDTCTGGGMCTQPSKTSTGQTGSKTSTGQTGGKTPASSAEELACGKWRDFVFAGIFVGVFMDWA